MADYFANDGSTGPSNAVPLTMNPIVSVPKAKRAASIDLSLDFPLDGLGGGGGGWPSTATTSEFDLHHSSQPLSGRGGDVFSMLGGGSNSGNNNNIPLHIPTHTSPLNGNGRSGSGGVEDLLQSLTPPLPPTNRTTSASSGLFGGGNNSSHIDDDFLIGGNGGSSSVFNHHNNSILSNSSPFAAGNSGGINSVLSGSSSLSGTPLGLFDSNSNNNSNSNWPFHMNNNNNRSSLQQPRATSSLGLAMSSYHMNNPNSLIASSITRPLSTPIYSSNSLLGGGGGGGLGSGLGGLGGLGSGQMDDMFATLGGSSSSLLQQQQQQRRTQGQGLPAMDSLLQGLNISRGGNNSNAINGGRGGLPALNQDSLSSHHQHLLSSNNNGNGTAATAAWPKPGRFNQNNSNGNGLFDNHYHSQQQQQQHSNNARIASPSPVIAGGPSHMTHTPNHLLHRRSNNNTPSNGHHNSNNNNNRNHHHSHNPHSLASNNTSSTMSPKLLIQNMDDRSLETLVTTSCGHILNDAAEHSLKAVELANTLRARVGTEVMAIVRERWGGLLTLLERHTDRFLVERIPKNDRVSLLVTNDGTVLPIANTVTTATEANNSNAVHGSGSGEEGGQDSSFVVHHDDNNGGILSASSISRPGTADPTLLAETSAGDSVFHRENIFSPGQGQGRNTMSASPSHHHQHHNNNHDDHQQQQQQATRCLHVGNVPSHYTEVQLATEFEKFGSIEGLKLISHKNGNRRFAFITFKTIAQAITARHCLSKIHPWKSAISFAHREPGQQGTGTGAIGGSYHNQHQNHSQNQNQNGYHRHSNHSSNGNGNGTGNGSSGHNHMLLAGLIGRTPSPQQHGMSLLPPLQLFPNDNSDTSASVASVLDALNNDFSVSGTAVATTTPAVSTVPTYSSIVAGGNSNHSNGNSNTAAGEVIDSTISSLVDSNDSKTSNGATAGVSIESLSLHQQQPQHDHHHTRNNTHNNHNHNHNHNHGHNHIHTPSSAREIAVMQRLCDDTYVPTQPWPIDQEADLPFCRAVIDQINSFGGSTTISKLRGFLKHRVGTVDNIKSVPLKAMLMSYAHLFKVDGNFVSLLPQQL